jgi:hypothetical protein
MSLKMRGGNRSLSNMPRDNGNNKSRVCGVETRMASRCLREKGARDSGVNPTRCFFIVFACLGLFRAVAFAQDPPNAAAVADKIGQEIQFQDEVKAVSYSRSTKGFYFSFGAPYPKQVLSVWTDRAIYDQLPFTGKLVGRTVRIRGKLEQSPTGPLLKLTSLDQLAVVETDEAILSQPVLDGRRDRHRFKAAVSQNLARDEFQTLETLAGELLQSREQSADGALLIDCFLYAFIVPVNAPDEDFAFLQSKLSAWSRARPASPLVPLLEAQLHRDLAWHAVGTGVFRTITKETRAVYRKEMATARQILESRPDAKVYPAYYEMLLSVATCQRWPRPAFFAVVDEATRAHPGYNLYQVSAAERLLPRWGGRPGEWEKFAEHERQRLGAGSAGDALYADIGWSMKHRYHNMFRETAVSWETMASGFHYMMKQHPQSEYLKNIYANFCWRAGDRARLREALPLVRANPDMEVWVNLENVAFAEKFAASNSP